MDFNYYRPITLLTTTYKIFAKALQLKLQPILRDGISPEQTAFLSLRFILDNIFLTQEALHWANTSRQPTVFLKLDFPKHMIKSLGDLFFKPWVKWTLARNLLVG